MVKGEMHLISPMQLPLLKNYSTVLLTVSRIGTNSMLFFDVERGFPVSTDIDEDNMIDCRLRRRKKHRDN